MGSIIRKLKPYYIRKAFRYLHHYGVRDFAVRVRERLAPEHVPYGPYYARHRVTDKELDWQRKGSKEQIARRRQEADCPLFSVVVPIYRTPERFFREMADSVLDQSWPDLQLVLANASPDDGKLCALLHEYQKKDSRVKVVTLKENRGISANTNAALEAADGEYVCFMDHDDVIEPDALYMAVQRITREMQQKRPRPLLIYTDEDKIRDDGKGGVEHFQPHFKPEFNLDLLRSNNYICHFLIVSRKLVQEVGGFDPGFDGAQDYDLVLRCTDRIRDMYRLGDFPDDGRCIQPGICRIPRVLYSWRVHAASTADNPDSKAYAYNAGKKALTAHLQRCGTEGEVMERADYGFYRIRYGMQEKPLVSVIIPSCEQPRVLRACIDSIHAHTDMEHAEVIVVENNSRSHQILSYYKEIQGKDHVRVIRCREKGFNFSKVCNYGAAHASGSYLVFMNNDVTVKDGWLPELLAVCARKEVGAAGPKLYFPDGKIQSAGIVVGIGGAAGSLFAGMNGSFSGYLHKADICQDLSAVTAALMIVKREAFEKAGGFSEDLAVAFNDVDLCLKIRRAGYLVVYDPCAEAVHHESVSRGDEYTKDKAERYRREKGILLERWQAFFDKGDPAYDPNLSLQRWDYSLNDE